MTQFSDEMLSAYLDGELSADERAAVEAHLAASESDRRLLDELQSLRGELQSLPRTSLGGDFADRVVQAAVAAKASQEATVTITTVQTPRSKRWPYWSAAIAVGLAACIVLLVQAWQPGSSEVAEGPGVTTPEQLDPTSVAQADAPPAERLIAQLYSAAPAEGEAVVLRLRVPKNAPLGQSLDAALAEAGIGFRSPTDVHTGAIQIGATYRKQIAQKHGAIQPGAENPALVGISDAVFVEASLADMEAALIALAADPKRKLDLAAEAKVAVAPPPTTGDPAESEPEGTNNGQPFAQRLNAGMYRLEKRDATPPTAAAAPPKVDRQRPVRILILVEQVEE